MEQTNDAIFDTINKMDDLVTAITDLKRLFGHAITYIATTIDAAQYCQTAPATAEIYRNSETISIVKNYTVIIVLLFFVLFSFFFVSSFSSFLFFSSSLSLFSVSFFPSFFFF